MQWDKSAPVTPEDKSPASGFPSFAPILSDAFEHVKNLPEPVTLPPGTLLLEQGANCETVWLIRQGLVRLTFVSPEGRENTLGLRTAGWFAGAANVVMRAPSIYSIKSVTPCLASRVPAYEFSARLAASARLTRHFVSTLCWELLAQNSAQARLMSDSAEQRLAAFMRERNNTHPGLKTLDALPMLKQLELAQLLAITPEHLSRLLHKSNGFTPPAATTQELPLSV